MVSLSLSTVLLSCLWMCIVLIGNLNAQQQNGGGNLRLNPYTLQYLKQLLARGGYKGVSNVRTQQIKVPNNNIKFKALSLNPAFKGSANTKYNVKPVGVNPQLVKALYGSTFLKPSGGGKLAAPGKYTYAQIQPKQPRPTLPKLPNTSPQKKNPLILAVPNLGSMLYKYAKQQEVTQKQGPSPTSVNQNLYKMFGQMTYGPMPKPSNFPTSSAVYRNQQQSSGGYRPQVSSFPTGYGQAPSSQKAPSQSLSSFMKNTGFGGSSNPYKPQQQQQLPSYRPQPAQPSYNTPQPQQKKQPSYTQQPASYQANAQSYSQQQSPPVSYQQKAPQPMSYRPANIAQPQSRGFAAPVKQQAQQPQYSVPQSGSNGGGSGGYGQSSYQAPSCE